MTGTAFAPDQEPAVSLPPQPFDELEHLRELRDYHRSQLRALGRRLAFLEQTQSHLLRIVGQLLLLAGDGEANLALLAALDQALAEEASIERLVELLRATDPDREPEVRMP